MLEVGSLSFYRDAGFGYDVYNARPCVQGNQDSVESTNNCP
jgi:hypothetical protein